MELTVEAINILFFLIPGLLSTTIISLIVVRKELSFIDKVIEALIFNFIIYSLTALFVNLEPFASITSSKSNISFLYTNNRFFLITLLLISVILPSFVGCIIYYDLHMRFLRFIKLTDKTSRATAWQDIFIEHKKFLVIHFKDGRRIYGWPLNYSDTPDEGLIYLFNPSWIDDDNKYIDCNTHGILIKYVDIEFIEFLKEEDFSEENNGDN